MAFAPAGSLAAWILIYPQSDSSSLFPLFYGVPMVVFLIYLLWVMHAYRQGFASDVREEEALLIMEMRQQQQQFLAPAYPAPGYSATHMVPYQGASSVGSASSPGLYIDAAGPVAASSPGPNRIAVPSKFPFNEPSLLVPSQLRGRLALRHVSHRGQSLLVILAITYGFCMVGYAIVLFVGSAFSSVFCSGCATDQTRLAAILLILAVLFLALVARFSSSVSTASSMQRLFDDRTHIQEFQERSGSMQSFPLPAQAHAPGGSHFLVAGVPSNFSSNASSARTSVQFPGSPVQSDDPSHGAAGALVGPGPGPGPVAYPSATLYFSNRSGPLAYPGSTTYMQHASNW